VFIWIFFVVGNKNKQRKAVLSRSGQIRQRLACPAPQRHIQLSRPEAALAWSQRSRLRETKRGDFLIRACVILTNTHDYPVAMRYSAYKLFFSFLLYLKCFEILFECYEEMQSLGYIQISRWFISHLLFLTFSDLYIGYSSRLCLFILMISLTRIYRYLISHLQTGLPGYKTISVTTSNKNRNQNMPFNLCHDIKWRLIPTIVIMNDKGSLAEVLLL